MLAVLMGIGTWQLVMLIMDWVNVEYLQFLWELELGSWLCLLWTGLMLCTCSSYGNWNLAVGYAYYGLD